MDYRLPDTARPIDHTFQRTAGKGFAVMARNRSGETHLADYRTSGAAKFKFPRHFGRSVSRPANIVLVNTSGGLTGGDKLEWQVTCEADSSVVVTSQAAEKIYRSLGAPAFVDARISAKAGSRVLWLPQETILFHQSNMKRHLTIDLAPTARGLFGELVVLGRTAHGELKPEVVFHEDWTVRINGRMIHRDAVKFDSAAASLFDRCGGLSGSGHAFRAYATLLYVGVDCESVGARFRSLTDQLAFERGTDVLAAASVLSVNGGQKLVVRAVASGAYALRQFVTRLLASMDDPFETPAMWPL